MLLWLASWPWNVLPGSPPTNQSMPLCMHACLGGSTACCHSSSRSAPAFLRIARHSASCLPPSHLPRSLPYAVQEFSGSACLEFLPSWPSLQVLALDGVRPTRLTISEMEALAAAPSLRRLELACSLASEGGAMALRQEAERMLVRTWRDSACKLQGLLPLPGSCPSWHRALARSPSICMHGLACRAICQPTRRGWAPLQEIERRLPGCTVAEYDF